MVRKTAYQSKKRESELSKARSRINKDLDIATNYLIDLESNLRKANKMGQYLKYKAKGYKVEVVSLREHVEMLEREIANGLGSFTES